MAPGDTNSTPSTTCRHPWRRSIQSSTASSTSTTITDHTEPLAEKPQPTILHNEQPMRPTRLICHEPGHALDPFDAPGFLLSRSAPSLKAAMANASADPDKAHADAVADAKRLMRLARTGGLGTLAGAGGR